MAIKLKKTQTKEEFQKRDTLIYIYILLWNFFFFFFCADFGKSSGQNNTKLMTETVFLFFNCDSKQTIGGFCLV